MKNQPLLSIGIIFKNEIRCLERFLISLEPLRAAIPCELVMADAGSDDGSREIAEKYADILIDFPWIDDFAAARSAVLDRCSGQWCLTLDCGAWPENIDPLVELLNGRAVESTNAAELRSGRSMASLRALAALGDRDPARCARVLLSCDRATIRAELDQIEDWDHILTPVLSHAVEQGVPMPDSFFRLSSEKLAALAPAAAQGVRGLAQAVLHYAPVKDYSESVQRLLWLCDLTGLALQDATWQNDGEGMALCGLFAQLEADLLGNLYNFPAIEETDVSALPPVHRFGWRLIRGIEALDRDEPEEYLRLLGDAAKDVPGMNKAALFLTAHLDDMRLLPDMRPPAPELEPPAPVPKAVPSAACRPLALDAKFLALVNEFSGLTVDEAFHRLRNDFQSKSERLQKALTDYLTHFPLWGSFCPDKDDFGVFEEKARSIVEHAKDYLWLYDRLEDVRSKKLLYAILRCVYCFDVSILCNCKETFFDDYFDQDVLPCGPDEVVADLGAYNGDTAWSYFKTYSVIPKRYYCYEISPDSMRSLKKNTVDLPSLVYRQKGVGERAGTMYLNVKPVGSANTLVEQGSEAVEVVALDEDITEPITLLKMDIEGAEQAAIRGAANHIRTDRPKMALSVYHNNEDLWKVPRMVDELCPRCRFYLRYHGGNLWPTEISLLAVPT